jgi:hypothetical protein
MFNGVTLLARQRHRIVLNLIAPVAQGSADVLESGVRDRVVLSSMHCNVITLSVAYCAEAECNPLLAAEQAPNLHNNFSTRPPVQNAMQFAERVTWFRR